jgi:hypothetical protein
LIHSATLNIIAKTPFRATLDMDSCCRHIRTHCPRDSNPVSGTYLTAGCRQGRIRQCGSHVLLQARATTADMLEIVHSRSAVDPLGMLTLAARRLRTAGDHNYGLLSASQLHSPCSCRSTCSQIGFWLCPRVYLACWSRS